MNERALIYNERPDLPPLRVEAIALLRRACQLMDSAGESERSMRARFVSAAFQLLYKDTPEQQAAFDECDRDPVSYLRSFFI